MDASDPEVRRTLEESLKNLVWMRAETRQRQAKMQNLYDRLDRLRESGKIDEVQHQIDRLKLATSRDAIADSLRMIQRQRALITSWIIAAEKKVD